MKHERKCSTCRYFKAGICAETGDGVTRADWCALWERKTGRAMVKKMNRGNKKTLKSSKKPAIVIVTTKPAMEPKP